MIFRKSEPVDRHEDRRRPCEVDGCKGWYHGLIHNDRIVVQPRGCMSPSRVAQYVRDIRSRGLIHPDLGAYQERHTYAMIEYLDGSVTKVDPEKVQFTDV